MAACDRCGKPTNRVVENYPLCSECYLLSQQIEIARAEAANDRQRLLMAMGNQLSALADSTVGSGYSTPRVNIPVKRAPQYNTIHNVNVAEGSRNIAINNGSAQSIAVAIGSTEKQGNASLATAFKAFTDALVNEPIGDEQKREMSEQLAVLSEEVTKPGETRRRAVVGPMLDGLNKAVNISATLSSLWEKLHPLLKQAFN